MSRLSKTIKNGWIAILFHLIYIGSQFISRNIFLKYLGDDFVGTTGTIKSIIQFLNLAEMGIGAAVAFSLYKPIFDKDNKKINEIIGYLGYLYNMIGRYLLAIGTIIIFLIPFLFKNSDVDSYLLIYLFIALLFGNLLSYFFAYPAFLLLADQKNYVNNILLQSIFVFRLLAQCITLIYFQNIILWITMEILFPIFYIIFLRKKVKQSYPWLNLKFRITDEVKKSNTNLLKKIKQLSIHKIGNFVSNGTDNIIIFSLISPESVAFLGNYQLVMNNINTLFNKLFEGTNASVGNLIAENKSKQIKSVFWEMNALRFFIAGSVSFSLFLGINVFIEVWLGAKYILDIYIIICLITIFFTLQIRQPVDCYIQAYGLYSDTWAPLAQSTINLVISIICVIKLGIVGVLLGTIISQISIVLIWRPYFLFTRGFNKNAISYYKGFFFHLLILTILFSFIYYSKINIVIKFTDEVLPNRIINITLESILFAITYFVTLYIFSSGFKGIIKRLYSFIIKRSK